MITELMFYLFWLESPDLVPKHSRTSRRHTGMQIQPAASAVARRIVMVVLAMLLILVLLPAVVAAQAATMT
jgi:hypothetical protein